MDAVDTQIAQTDAPSPADTTVSHAEGGDEDSVEMDTSGPVAPPITYREFVRKQFATLSKTEYPNGRQRMRMCADAWQKLDPKFKAKAAKRQRTKASKAASGVDAARGGSIMRTIPTATAAPLPVGAGVSTTDVHGTPHPGIVVKSWSDLAHFVHLPTAAFSNSPSQSFKRTKLQLLRTKSTQRAINNGIRAFTSRVKEGKVPDHYAAFLAGINLISNNIQS